MRIFTTSSAGVTVIFERELVRLWDEDYRLIGVVPDGVRVDAFVAAHVQPGGYVNVTRDHGGTRWSGRAEVSVTYTQDYEHLKAIVAEPNPWLARSQW